MDQPNSQSDGFSRIDGAHQLSADVAAVPIETPQPSLVAAAAGTAEAMQGEQTQLQGHQLMIELTRRQREIDRRESQFNAFLATLDRDARSQRIKQQELEDDLTTREQEYAARLAVLEQRESVSRSDEQLGEVQQRDDRELRKLRQELEERRIRIEAEEIALRHRWQKVHAQREDSMQLIRHLMRSIERRREAMEQQAEQQCCTSAGGANVAELDKIAKELDERKQTLLDAQSAVAKEREELSTERQQFRKERQEWTASQRRAEERFNQQKSIERAEQKQRKEILDQRSDELSKRKAALIQMQADIANTHREALEVRLATEQLWSQLGENIAPEELAATLGELRSKLSEHYRAAEGALAAQRNELQEMAARLDEQQIRIRDDRIQQQQWAERRHQEIEFQAARLVAREQQLESQQSQNAQAHERWEQQRHEYEDEIRRLQAAIRQQRAAA